MLKSIGQVSGRSIRGLGSHLHVEVWMAGRLRFMIITKKYEVFNS